MGARPPKTSAAVRSGDGSRDRAAARALARLVTWTALFVVAGYAGRATIIDGRSLSLVWPAAGVVLLWLCTSTRRTLPLDVLAVVVVTLVVDLDTGASLRLSVVFVVCNLLQAGLVIATTRRLCPDVWGFGGDRPLGRLSELGALSAVALGSCLVSATVGTVGVAWATGSSELLTLRTVENLVAWAGRNWAGVVVIGVLGLLVLPHLRGARGPVEVGRRLWRLLLPRSPWRRVELAGLLALHAAAIWVVYFGLSRTPLLFVVVFTSVLLGARLRATTVALVGLVGGAVMIVLTLDDRSVLATIADPQLRALVVQAHVTLTVVTALVLSLTLSERRHLAADLRASQEAAAERATFLQAVLEHMNDGIAVIDEDGRVVVRNPPDRRILGLPGATSPTVLPAEAYGLLLPDGTRVTEETMPHALALARDEPVSGDYVVGGDAEEDPVPPSLPDEAPGLPSSRVLEISAVPLASLRPGDPRRVIVSYRDVTAERAHRESLTMFAGVVAHDLLNPLAAIRNWGELFARRFDDGPVGELEGRRLLARIDEAAEHMGEFISDLLAYTVSGNLTMHRADLDLTALAADVAQQVVGAGATPGGAPVVEVAPGLKVHADPTLVRQLLGNLIGNAAKYVDEGVRPHVRLDGIDDGRWLHVRVADNGIGVPAAQREQIFTNLHRAHPDASYTGTGIGLAVCRQVVQRHGGTIWVTDNPDGPGSTFHLTLPQAVG